MTSLTKKVRTAVVGVAAAAASMGATAAVDAAPASAASAVFTIAPTLPKLNYVVCDSYYDRMTVDLVPGTVTRLATLLQIRDVRTGVWYATPWIVTGNTGSIDTARFGNIRGTYDVWLNVMYLDAAGTWQWVYRNWAPTMDSYGPNMDATCTIT